MKRAYCEAMTNAIMRQNKTMPNDEKQGIELARWLG